MLCQCVCITHVQRMQTFRHKHTGSGTVLIDDGGVRAVALWRAFYEVLEHFFMPCGGLGRPSLCHCPLRLYCQQSGATSREEARMWNAHAKVGRGGEGGDRYLA